MRVHFIAIGGSAMHNLAIALCKKGYQVTGSDDEIFEPAKSRLERYGLLPKTIGWNPDLIDENINAVILGMHAKEDNPELIKAKQLGLKIYSYPEYLYEISSSKIRVVVGGSHGKTSITAMILHALQTLNVKTDYMVGAMLEGFEVMVKVEDDSKYMVLEGDEYLSSTLDRRPKFHLYKPDIAIINGIAWDHINVFPTFENYVEQFKIFADKIENGGRLIYFDGDENIRNIAANVRNDIKTMPYNGLNMNAAMLACESLGINRDSFLETMQSFKGAAKRLELLASNDTKAIYTDFAHSPSKLKATIEAVKEQYPNRKLVACMELHTFSSLSKNFLEQYKGCMNKADKALVYYNHHAIELKRLENLSVELVEKAFDKEGLKVTTDSSEFVQFVKQNAEDNTNILIMSSGNFGGVNIKQLAEEVI